MANKGLPFIGKVNEFLGKVLHPTVQKVGNSRAAIEVIHKGYYLLNPTPSIPYSVESGSTDNLVKVTAHGFRAGDMVRLLATTNSIKEFEIIIDEIVDADNFKLAGYLSASLTTGDTFNCLRAVSERFSSDGSSLASVSTPPLSYNRKVAGVTTQTTVIEDLDTAINSRALPVVIHSIDGAPIVVNAGDLSVSISHANDSVAIGDGTNLVGVTGSNELKTKDSGLLTELQLKADLTEKQYVNIVGELDPNNTSTTALGIGATFTGTWTSTKDYSAVALGVMTNVNSATDGLKYQFSHDGVTVHHEHTYTYIADTYGSGYSVPVEFRYYRVVYVNGAVAQSSLLISSTLKQTASFPSSYKITQAISGQTQALFTRGVIVGETTGGGGGYVNVKVNPSGALVTEATLAASVATRIGTVAIDQTTPGSTNAVSVTNASFAVTGTFWQATQPVSIASMPSTPVTGTFWQATQPVSIASMPSTPVTGTFWQATQPISIAAAVKNFGTAKTTSYDELLTLSTVATFTAPSNAIGALIQASDVNAANIRFRTGTATATSGIQLQPGRSEKIDGGTSISVCSESGTNAVSILWFIEAQS